MSDSLRQIRPKDLIKALKKLGFVKRRQKGSHMTLKHPVTRRMTVVGVHHKTIKRGTLNSIIKQTGISKEELIKALKK